VLCVLCRSLDLSFNKIRKIEHISYLTNLNELYFANNRISVIPLDVIGLTRLTTLELGSNGIRVRHHTCCAVWARFNHYLIQNVENLSTLTNLKNLWLGRNKITKIEGLDTLTQLKRLDLQTNRIVSLEGLNGLVSLEELYLAHNGVPNIQNVQSMVRLISGT
jgi:protein phosphatase 1 regulatory subunit 7